MSVYPLKPHIYIAKLGYGGVYRFFIILLQNIDCWYHVLSKNKIIIKRFLVKILNFYNLRKIYKYMCVWGGGGGGVVINFVFSRDQMRTHPNRSSLTKLLHCIVTVYLFFFFFFSLLLRFCQIWLKQRRKNVIGRWLQACFFAALTDGLCHSFICKLSWCQHTVVKHTNKSCIGTNYNGVN